MSLSIEGARKLLDSMIANKVAYLEKSDNKFIKEEVDNLAKVNGSLKDTHRMMAYLAEQKEQHIDLIRKLQISYRLLMKLYEMQILGKLDVRKIKNIEEWKMDLDRLLKTPENVE